VAKLQSLKYFNERWVTVGARSVLRGQRAVIRGIRLFFALSIISAALVLILGPVLVTASAPLGGSFSAGMLAWWLVFLIIGAGAAVLWYFAMQWNQICRWILVGLHALLSLIVIVYIMVLAVGTYTPAMYLLPTILVLLINVLVIWVLLCPTASNLYRFNQTH